MRKMRAQKKQIVKNNPKYQVQKNETFDNEILGKVGDLKALVPVIVPSNDGILEETSSPHDAANHSTTIKNIVSFVDITNARRLMMFLPS